MTTGMKRLIARETQASIAAWQRDVFGPSVNIRASAARANQEMAELLKALAVNDAHPKAPEEVADVIICLVRIADNLGFSISDEIDKKMARNRARK